MRRYLWKDEPAINKETNGLPTSTCLFHGCDAMIIVNVIIVGCRCKRVCLVFAEVLVLIWCHDICNHHDYIAGLADTPQGGPT